MTLDVTGVLRDAWTMAKRDAQILAAVAGLLIFVPQLAILLLVTPSLVIPADFQNNPATQQAFVLQMQAWLAANLPGLLAAAVAILIAQITLIALYVDPERPSVARALTHAPLRFFAALLISLLASPLAVSIQLIPLLIIPAAYLEGRLLLTMPMLLAQQPISALGAIRASWRRTAGHGLVCAGLACIGVLPAVILAVPLNGLGRAMNGAPMANPVVALLICGTGALVVTLGAVAKILIDVALYRRLSNGT